jgi:hypothetical protein
MEAAEAVVGEEAAAAEEAAVVVVPGEAVGEEAAGEPVAAALGLQERAPGQEQEQEQGQAAEVAPAVVTLMLSRILTSDRFIAAVSARGRFSFTGVGLVTALLIGFTETRTNLVGMCAGTRNTGAFCSDLTRLSG